jgi:hypothetical protein
MCSPQHGKAMEFIEKTLPQELSPKATIYVRTAGPKAGELFIPAIQFNEFISSKLTYFGVPQVDDLEEITAAQELMEENDESTQEI